MPIKNQPRPRQIGFDAAGAAAVARGQRRIGFARQRKRIVSPLPGDRVRPDENPAVDDREIMAYLSRKLPAYMLPKRIAVLADLPLNANGKIDRGVLAVRANAA